MKETSDTLDFLGEVYIQFKRSEVMYEHYLKDGKRFLYARVLRNCNERIRELLIKNSSLLSQELMRDSVEIIAHFDVWLEKWKELERSLKPQLDDEFIFQNTFRFPREACENLMNEFLRIKQG